MHVYFVNTSIFFVIQGNEVTATLYDTNITALNDQLQLGKTYIISNATVKENRSQFKTSPDEKIWTITGRTKIEELHENNLNFIFLQYQLTPFHELEQHMDKNSNISKIPIKYFTVINMFFKYITYKINEIIKFFFFTGVVGVAVDVRQKRIIQTHFGTEATLQDITLIDKEFQTVMLTLWDSFVERECVTITANLANRPVIWATNLKVSSFNGINTNPKFSSSKFIYSI